MVPAAIAAVRPIDLEVVTGGRRVSKGQAPRWETPRAPRVKGLLYDAVRCFTSDASGWSAGAAGIVLTKDLSVVTHIIVIDDQGLMECGDCLCLASRRAARGLTRAFDRQLRPYGIRATQFSILTMLLMRGPLRIGELAEYLGLERTTLTRNLAVIEEKGWVVIRPGDDARARVVAATKKGYAAVTGARAAWRKAQQAASAAIGNAGVNALHALARSV